MKFFVSLFLIMLLSFASCLYFPWWSIAIVAFIIAVFIHQEAGMSFLCGFLALFLLWGILSFWISANNDHILAHRVSVLILTVDSPYLLIFFTAVIGGIVAGLGATAGSFISRKKVTQSSY